VKATAIQKCFRRAGILNTDLGVQTLCEDEDPFQDIDIQVGMSSLISTSMGTLIHCSLDEYIDGDNSRPTCVEIAVTQDPRNQVLAADYREYSSDV